MMDWDDNFQDIVDKLNAAALEVKDLQDQLAEQERLIEAVALALDGLPITGERTGPRSAKYLDLPDQIGALREQLAQASWALKFIGAKSYCSCWRVPGLSSDLSVKWVLSGSRFNSRMWAKWVGCSVYPSKDPNEWCLPCIANAALAWITEKVKNGI